MWLPLRVDLFFARRLAEPFAYWVERRVGLSSRQLEYGMIGLAFLCGAFAVNDEIRVAGFRNIFLLIVVAVLVVLMLVWLTYRHTQYDEYGWTAVEYDDSLYGDWTGILDAAIRLSLVLLDVGWMLQTAHILISAGWSVLAKSSLDRMFIALSLMLLCVIIAMYVRLARPPPSDHMMAEDKGNSKQLPVLS